MSPSEIQVILQLKALSISVLSRKHQFSKHFILCTSRGSFFSVLEAEASI